METHDTDGAGRTDGGYGWIIVAAGALITCVAAGAMFSLAVYLQPISADTGWSRAGISAAMTLDFLVMGIAAFGWGALSDRYGTRPVVLAASVLLGLGLLLASRATSLTAFQLGYGVLVGVAGGAFFAPLMALATTWFERHRALAVSLVSAGMGVAPMTVSPLAGWLILEYGWRTAMATTGIAALLLLIPAGLLIRQPPAAWLAGQAHAEAAGPAPSVRQALRSAPFIALALTFFLCCAAHSGPIFHVVSFATFCGIAPMAAVTIYSVEGLAGLGGRLLLGALADRLGTRRVLIAGLLLQAVVIGVYSQARLIGEFYGLSILLGAAYGGVMPLYAVLARDWFGPRIMGSIFGAAVMASSLGMAFGPLAGGWIFDHFNGYAWLYLGSAAVGIGAVAVAFAFPRSPARPALQAG
ncbi:MFS transporter [Pigmentiphaga sp.]|uniref:MFS transporter n=1 Tax=Pigmentiphaga sp. TaxID=1977564 RepID=UPI00128BCD9C|nr:MFS transporter [Pigmentiphaga sp.]MPS27347.1 MFS transporter [Alcaligenaceae bacterium SAGV5]MPS51483.1 MFS transporter [Alcaligenaceae bacterium SAGV3]MPT59705.1 MFS transporter [Alcaligenaceae bacterium]